MKIFGHRGSSKEAPENTLKAINLAWEEGADGVEIDVRLTKDQKIVVVHDASVWRTAGGRDWKVADRTFEDLRKLDFGDDEKIPLLEEAISTIPPDKTLLIEIKDANVLEFLPQVIEDSGKSNQLILQSFRLAEIQKIKSDMADMPVFWIKDTYVTGKKIKRAAYKKGKTTSQKATQKELRDRAELWMNRTIQQCKEEGLNGLVCNKFLFSTALVRGLHKIGLSIFAWLPDNSPEAVKKVKARGGDAVIVDSPGLIREVLE
jgi:glycerophosphoryl diester phosphodiesterase